MSTFSKKLVSGALTATTGIWMSGVLMLVPVAHGQTVTDLQAQIAGLLAQIQQLQQQLAGGGSTSASYTFNTNLTIGSRGADVSALQQILIDKGYLKIAAPTGYFGTLTRAAVAAWQAASGISPTAGYFGPKSRAAMNAMVVTPPSPTPTPTPGTPPPVAGTGLSVSLASTNPAAGSLISSAASAASRVPVMSVNFTAGTGSAVTVNSINFKKTGVLSDTAISGAYLVQNGRVVAQYNSLSGGVITFSGLGWSVPAGQTMTLDLAIDPASGLSAGNTVGFALLAAADVSATDALNNAVTPSGVFPLNGNIFTVTSVSNPSLASIATVASSAIGTQVTAGTTNNLVAAWNFTVANSKVWLKGLTLKVIGSANKSDLKNVKLKVNGADAGTALAQVGVDGVAHFDLNAAPATLNTGANNIQVYADVLGSPSYDFQFEILNSYDIYAIDSQYNVPVSAASNIGTKVTIQAGTVTVTQASNTPTGSVAKGQSSVALLKFNFYAGGEAVKIKFLDFSLGFTGTTTTLANTIKNINLTDDAGNQVGTTINSPPTSNSCSDSGSNVTAGYNTAGTVYTDCFGTSGSPINYIVPANTTRVLTLRGDVQSTAVFSTILASLTGNTNNVQGLTSSQNASTGGVTGSALTLASTSLTVAKNTAVGNQNVTPSSNNKRIGSYAFSAASAEGVTISSISITAGANGSSTQNLKIMIGGTQFGTTQATVVASGVYSFSGSPFTVPAGGTTIVDVYADILSGAPAGTLATITTLSGCSGSGASSLTAISCSSVAGQSVVVSGQATVQFALDSGSPAANQLVMGSTNNELARFRLTETSNVEDVKITDLNVFDQVSSTTLVKSAFDSVTLYKSTDLSTPLAVAGSANTSVATSTGVGTSTTGGPGYYYKFHFNSPVVVPQSNSITLVLKGGVASYSSSGATDNTTHVFKISTSTDSDNDSAAEAVVALGSTSNATSAVSFSSPTGNAMTILRSKLTVSATPLGATSGRAKSAVDDLATLTFAADSAGSVTVNTVTITYSGSAPSGTNFFNPSAGKVTLYDPSNGTTYNPSATTTTSLSYNLGYTVSAGTSKGFTLRLDSTAPQTAAASNGVSQTLSATISATTGLTWTDAVDGAAVSGLNLPSVVIPVNIQSVSYAAGT